eukprot:TRINITY_DN30905_c0_g1_i3.p1 TRINITY_DN30905_c0_g1~~TRINITY_DN30905_c0_g1_i3.p1  ORF type:complete len:281 (-),score=69.32 TRINITY_DN30905_c0_g1_i3:1050-1892(-)
MDIEEWEILSDDGFLDFHQRDEKRLLARKSGCDPKGGADTNYIICSSPPARQLVPVPIRLEPMVEKNQDREVAKDIGQVPTVEISVAEPVVLEKIKNLTWEGDQDTISQVFFKKMKDNEFVDMKMDSPRSKGGSRGLKPQLELGGIQFEEKEDCKCEDFDQKEVIFEQETGTKYTGPETKEKGCWEGGKLNIWRWRVTGIGALCSMGVAAAGVFIFILGGHQRQKQQSQNPKLQFQIYAEDKSIKQVVQHASRLNQALSSLREVPLTRAHITFGGYYDGP